MADHEQPDRQLDLLSLSSLDTRAAPRDEAPPRVAEKLAVRWVEHDGPGRLGRAAWPGSGIGLTEDLEHLRQHHRATVLLAVAEDPAELVEAARAHQLDVRHLPVAAAPERLAQQAAGLAADLRAGRRAVVVSADPSEAARTVACALIIVGKTVEEALAALGSPLDAKDGEAVAAFAARTGRVDAPPSSLVEAPAIASAKAEKAEKRPAKAEEAEKRPAKGLTAPLTLLAPLDRLDSRDAFEAPDDDPFALESLDDDPLESLDDDPFADDAPFEEPARAPAARAPAMARVEATGAPLIRIEASGGPLDAVARSPRKARLVGAVLGGAIGDAMGHPTEFIRSFQAIRERFGPDGVTGYELWRTEGGRRFAPYTDDTQMAECVLRSLLAGREKGADLDATMRDMAERFVAWAKTPQGGHRAPGNACLAGCRNLERGTPWHEAGGATAGGCGSVMRAYPFGLMFAHDLERAEAWAVAHSKLTHRDPIALAASAAMAVGMARVVRDEPVEVVLSEMVAAACRYSPKTAGMMARAIDEAWSGVGPETTLERLEGWAAHEAIAAAVYLFARHPDDPRAAILEGANTPGDSDSLATLAGALVGARAGLGALPAEWVRDVERVEELTELALAIG